MGAEELRHPHSSAALFARISCLASDVKCLEDAASNCPGCDQQKSFLFVNHIPGVDAAISKLNGDGNFRWLRNPRNIEEFAVLGQTIGSGAFADVFRARDKKSGQIVAVKQLEFKEEIDRCTRREIDLLACLRHPSIVELKEVAVDSGLQNLYLVMEYVDTDLRKIITKRVPRLSNWNVKHLMSQLLKGVSFMHRNGFLHRDLKPENLLVNEDMQLKICDFGLARRFDENKNYSVNVVTLWYRAPELLLGAPEYSEAVDVWAIGCIMAELLLQQPLFRGKTEVDQLDKIFRILGTPDLKCWPDFGTLTQGSHWSPYPGTLDLIRVSTEYPLEDAAYDLLNKLLTYDPKKRITAEDASKHEWFCSDSGDWMAGLE